MTRAAVLTEAMRGSRGRGPSGERQAMNFSRSLQEATLPRVLPSRPKGQKAKTAEEDEPRVGYCRRDMTRRLS